jgi:hypothetical protein
MLYLGLVREIKQLQKCGVSRYITAAETTVVTVTPHQLLVADHGESCLSNPRVDGLPGKRAWRNLCTSKIQRLSV